MNGKIQSCVYVKLVPLVLAAAILAGCAIGARNEQMVPASSFVIAAKHPYSVSTRVLGGRESEFGSLPQISESAFTQALEAAIIQSQVFSRVMKGNSGEYLLTAIIADLQQPLWALNAEVNLEVGWTLSDNRTGQILWQESIKSIGTGRIREATENAAKDNMTEALVKISRLDL